MAHIMILTSVQFTVSWI